jgi:hypothetical protein
MAGRKIISRIPSDAEVSTQQNAEMLNISKRHIAKLLEKVFILFRKAGNHSRILLKDLLKSDQEIK